MVFGKELFRDCSGARRQANLPRSAKVVDDAHQAGNAVVPPLDHGA
jgi:hypothetical protein